MSSSATKATPPAPATTPLPLTSAVLESIPGIRFVDYRDESQLDYVMNLVGRDLSEPYSSEYMKVYDILYNKAWP